MKILMATLVMVLGVVGLATAPAGAVRRPEFVTSIYQAIDGGGTGTVFVGPSLDTSAELGEYTSNGQLGNGHFAISSAAFGPRNALFTRADGMQLGGKVTATDCPVPASTNTHCLVGDLRGTADVGQAHLEIAETYTALTVDIGFLMRRTLSLRRRHGYAMVGAHGTVYGFGGMWGFGDAPTSAATSIVATSSGTGYWVVDASGHVSAFGDAPHYGDASAVAPGEVVTSLSANPAAQGIWLFTSKGRVLPIADAHSFGDLRATHLNGGIIGSVATPSGKGYYMLGSDGGVFAFGDARFRGSMGATHLNAPIVAIVPTANNQGYWLVGADGGVFSFNAPFLGSLGALHLAQPIVGMTRYGDAYLMAAADGGVFNFSKRPFFGSVAGTPLPGRIVGITATR